MTDKLVKTNSVLVREVKANTGGLQVLTGYFLHDHHPPSAKRKKKKKRQNPENQESTKVQNKENSSRHCVRDTKFFQDPSISFVKQKP